MGQVVFCYRQPTADQPERVAHAYGPNARRLIAAKRAYDPGNVFTATPLPGVAAPRT